MKLLRNICRILVGIVFIYSGVVKGVDPLGSDYKCLGSHFVYGIFYSSHPDPGYQESGHRLRMFRGCPDLNQLGNFLEKYHSAGDDISYLLHKR